MPTPYSAEKGLIKGVNAFIGMLIKAIFNLIELSPGFIISIFNLLGSFENMLKRIKKLNQFYKTIFIHSYKIKKEQ